MDNFEIAKQRISDFASEIFDTYKIYEKIIDNDTDAAAYSAYFGDVVFLIEGIKNDKKIRGELKFAPHDNLSRIIMM
ncbi:hypothetical protein ACR79R_21290 [Sphingobacterium spiritivorum]|uniref:hypothetical protein n=1 Tax=Sphingobacterium spiritivorum TaxID=258 RepID=UPI003DA3B65E